MRPADARSPQSSPRGVTATCCRSPRRRSAARGGSSPPRGSGRHDGVVAPGLCDLQVNGGAGANVTDGPAALDAIDALQLDHGVTPVVGVQFDGGAGAVGDERVVTPVGPQLRLVAGQPGAAHDQPLVVAEGGFGDLRPAARQSFD